jgi:hypothetical protein
MNKSRNLHARGSRQSFHYLIRYNDILS